MLPRATDLERLWCVLELFVFIEMGGRMENIQLYFVPPEEDEESGRDLANEAEYFQERFANFDVANANCYDPVQRDRLLAVVESGFGGLENFNSVLKTTMQELQSKAAVVITRHRRASQLGSTETANRPEVSSSADAATPVFAEWNVHRRTDVDV